MRPFYIEGSTIFGIGILLAALGMWMQYGINETRKDHDVGIVYERPEYVIETFTITTSDGDGLSYILKGEKLRHFSNGTTDIVEPCFILFDRQDPVRVFSAETAKIIKSGDRVILGGNVVTLEHKQKTFSWLRDYCPPPMNHINQKSTTKDTEIKLKPLFKVASPISAPSEI